MNSESSKPATPEYIEPTSGAAPVPVWLFVLVTVLAFWGMGFLDKHGGGFEAGVYAPYVSRKELEDEWPKSEGGKVFALGKFVYEEKAKCTACHQPTGLGTPGQFPPLAGSDWALAKEPGRIIRIVLDGLQGPVTVNGQPFTNVMVPWRDTLSDDEIAAVLTYVRQSWGNSASDVKPEEVKAIREKTASHSGQWFADELLKISESE